MRDPKLLYRYRSLRTDQDLERLGRTLLHDELYFATVKEFNDPFEFRFLMDSNADRGEVLNFFVRNLQRLNPGMSGGEASKKAIEVWDRLSPIERAGRIHEAGEKSVQSLRTTLGVLCLSEPNDDPLLWSHYADGHMGICLEFAASNQTPFFARALPVSYTDEMPTLNPFRDSYDDRLTKSIYTKAARWSYEREWRYVDHVGGPGVKTFPAESLLSLIFGVQISSGHEEQIRKWLGERGRPVRLRRCELVPGRYALRVVDCS